ncbi:MAG: sugar phosphate nucleotidyltransferase [Alphaproteobacteria bacterium]
MTMPPIIVLAGGLGTRLHPVTQTMPKAMLAVAERPFIAHQLELFARRGITEAVYCLGHLAEQIEGFVGDGSRFGVEVRYAHDGDRLLGTGGAVCHALPMVGDEFLVTYGDSYLDIDYASVVDTHRTSGAPALMTVFKNDGQWDTSNVEFSDGKIIAYDKKSQTPRMKHIDYGLLAMDRTVFDPWKSEEPLDLAVVLGDLVKTKKLSGFETTTRFYENGSRAGIADLTAHLSAMG